MSAAADQRIADIRAAVRQERARLSELNGQISADLKSYLKLASGQLSDAEGWLAPEILCEPRSPRAMARWLDFVEGILARAIKQRRAVEALIKKHGPDARLIGSR